MPPGMERRACYSRWPTLEEDCPGIASWNCHGPASSSCRNKFSCVHSPSTWSYEPNQLIQALLLSPDDRILRTQSSPVIVLIITHKAPWVSEILKNPDQFYCHPSLASSAHSLSTLSSHDRGTLTACGHVRTEFGQEAIRNCRVVW